MSTKAPTYYTDDQKISVQHYQDDVIGISADGQEVLVDMEMAMDLGNILSEIYHQWLAMKAKRNTIVKYMLDFANVQELTLPAGADPLSVMGQGNLIALFVHVDSNAPLTDKYQVFMHETGGDAPDDAEMYHIGTVQAGLYIWHVFLKKL